jgi:Haem utilisation ChuX/HutX
VAGAVGGHHGRADELGRGTAYRAYAIVLECADKIPPGSFARGYFNLHGDSPLGGNLKAENCTHIAFVSRPFMGRPSRSLQFLHGAGQAMFKFSCVAMTSASYWPSRWRALTRCEAG